MDRQYHEIDDTIKIDFKIPSCLQQMIDGAEQADMDDNLGLYLDFADTIDVMAKNMCAEGYYTKEQWDKLTRRYKQW